jgi:enterochelin esterase-like enzyme
MAAVVAGAGLSRSASAPVKTFTVSCPSVALGGALPAAVYLPAGYVGGSTRYPVIYFLHGLPALPTSYETVAFVARAVAATGRRAIVVAPQGARQPEGDAEYLNWSATSDWPMAIARDLPTCIDSRFRTIANRNGRALAGLSAGGFGAFNIGLRNLATFAVVESWSGYFAATDPSGLQILNLGSKAANRKARVRRGRRLSGAVAQQPTFIGFFVGRQDTRFLTANIRLDATFTAKGIPHVFELYAGGHGEAFWTKQAPLWLGLALDHLSRAQTLR